MTAWRVRRVDGRTHTLDSDITVQRWILDGLLEPDDELQRGDAWRPLGTIPEFDAFFFALAAARPRLAPQVKAEPEMESAVKAEPEAASKPEPVAEPVPIPNQQPTLPWGTEIAPSKTTSTGPAVRARGRGRVAMLAVVLGLAVAVEYVGLFERDAVSSVLEANGVRIPRSARRHPVHARRAAPTPPSAVIGRAVPETPPPAAPTAAPAIETIVTDVTPKEPDHAELPEGHGYYYYATLGDDLHARSGCTDAIAAWERAAELRRRAPEPLTSIGECLLERGEVDAAAERFEAALRARPGYPRAQADLERIEELRRVP